MYAISCTRNNDLTPIKNKLIVSFASAGIDTHFISGASSIFDGYTNGLKEISPDPQDIIILCHDDIEILSPADHLIKYLNLLKNSKFGFLGVAGTSYLDDPCIWWQSPRQSLKGIVWHGNDLSTSHATHYGPYGEALVMDGLFLACRAELLYKIGTEKPSYLSGLWDFYDLRYTLAASLLGYKNFVVPIHIMHNSPGMGILSESWKKNRESFVDKYKKYFPRNT